MEESHELSHYQMVAAKQKQREINSDKHKERCKKRLSNIITTKIKTSFVGAISAYEENFGFLWGHGKEEKDLDQNELAMREIWESVRSKVLDNGNSQLRASVNEMNNYNIDWNMHRVELPIIESYNKENDSE
jgi:hypothetical protein